MIKEYKETLIKLQELLDDPTTRNEKLRTHITLSISEYGDFIKELIELHTPHESFENIDRLLDQADHNKMFAKHCVQMAREKKEKELEIQFVEEYIYWVSEHGNLRRQWTTEYNRLKKLAGRV